MRAVVEVAATVAFEESGIERVAQLMKVTSRQRMTKPRCSSARSIIHTVSELYARAVAVSQPPAGGLQCESRGKVPFGYVVVPRCEEEPLRSRHRTLLRAQSANWSLRGRSYTFV